VEINERILRKIQEWQEKEGALPQALELYRDLLLVQVEAKTNVSLARPQSSRAEVSAMLRGGVPLVGWGALSIDWPAFQKLFQASSDVISEYTDPEQKKSKDTAFNVPLLQEIARAWYEGASLSPWAEEHGIAEDLLAAAIHCATKPFLTVQAEALAGLVDQEQWRRGYCPVCGGKPDFAFLDKERGARWLLCSRCDTEWLFQRLECPYCGTNDQNNLAFFTDDKELYRLYVCQRCNSYLKAIDLRRTESGVLLPLERVLTIDMDRQGLEEGYKSGLAATMSCDRISCAGHPDQ
jgi:formate dehydrogenase maturation protein FdhE